MRGCELSEAGSCRGEPLWPPLDLLLRDYDSETVLQALTVFFLWIIYTFPYSVLYQSHDYDVKPVVTHGVRYAVDDMILLAELLLWPKSV